MGRASVAHASGGVDAGLHCRMVAFSDNLLEDIALQCPAAEKFAPSDMAMQCCSYDRDALYGLAHWSVREAYCSFMGEDEVRARRLIHDGLLCLVLVGHLPLSTIDEMESELWK